MAGRSPEVPRELPKEPWKIVTERTNFEIIIPSQGRRVSLKVLPDGSITTRVEALTSREEQRLEAEIQFGGITRNLIAAYLDFEAARLRPGSEEISPELSVISLERQFDQATSALSNAGYSDKQLARLIEGQARQLTVGEEHMGEVPAIIKDQITRLSKRVTDFYLAKARKAREPRLGR